jgi:GTPase SAR1 family protein
MSNGTNTYNYTQSNSGLVFISICIVGCVSAGKSTILNAFFSHNYSQCKIKRTTMMPSKFIETKNPGMIDSIDKINGNIKDTNDEIYKQTSAGKKLDLKEYGYELEFYVESMELNMGKKIPICIYDIPGLNDAKTKNTYYEYLKNNFHKFDIILFVVDIQSGLNTSDEIDILNFLSDNIIKHKVESKKNIAMLTVVNKADDMQLGLGDKLEVLGELGEMFEQTKTTITDVFNKKNIKNNLFGCIPICGLDAHLYRMIKKYKNVSILSSEHILRIGINDEGSKFRRYTPEIQREKVANIIMDNDFSESMIKLSGFSQIEDCINQYISANGNTMVSDNILRELRQLGEITLQNFINYAVSYVKIISKLIEFDQTKYNTGMTQLIKQINTLVYKKINTLQDPNEIKRFYDNEFVKALQTQMPLILQLKINNFVNLNVYPSYFVDRILELVIAEFTNNEVPLLSLKYFELFENIGNLKVEIIDLLLEALMSNPRGIKTFSNINFDERNLYGLLEKIKISGKFIAFLRFLLMNSYSGNVVTAENLIYCKMLFRKYGEIPMYEFIGQIMAEKKTYNTSSCKSYLNGITEAHMMANTFERYYISKCKEFGDFNNFINL